MTGTARVPGPRSSSAYSSRPRPPQIQPPTDEALVRLGLDRRTLGALGLEPATVDATYRALYVHAVGAHALVRRAKADCESSGAPRRGLAL